MKGLSPRIAIALVLLAIGLVVLFLLANPSAVPPPPADEPREPAPAPEAPVEPPLPPSGEPEPKAEEPETGEWRIDITALGPDGAPLTEQFHAKFWVPGERRPSASLFTEEKGSRFSLPVKGSGYLVIACVTAAHTPVVFEGLTRPDSGEMAIEARFTDGLLISGELIDQDGVTPAAGRVHLRVLDPDIWRGERPGHASVGDDGRFRIPGLLPGRYEVNVRPKDGGSGGRPVPSPVVEAGGPPLRIVLRPMTRLRVRVVVDGEPAVVEGWAHTIICIVNGAGRTLSSTSWGGPPSCERDYFVPPGQTIDVQVTSKGYVRTGGGKVEIGPNDRDAEVEVIVAAASGPKATLIIRPTDSLGREVFTLLVARRVSPGVTTGWELVAEGGAIEVTLEPGESQLVLSAPGRATPLKQSLLEQELTVQLASGERKVVDIEMIVGGWVRVLGYSGKWNEMYAAPAGEDLKLSPPKAAPDRNGRLLNKGAPLSPGRWVLEWRREGEDPVRREVEVKPEEVVEVVF